MASIRWDSTEIHFKSQETLINVKRKTLKRLNFEIDPPLQLRAKSPLHPAILTLQSEGVTQQIPVYILWVPPHQATSYLFDFDRDGNQEFVLENAQTRIVVNPRAGGRITQMISKKTGENVVATAGMLRDMFALMEPLDTMWENEKLPGWTRSRIPGLNTRQYTIETIVHTETQAVVILFYQAPDISHQGAIIKKTIGLDPDVSSIWVRYEVHISSGDPMQEFKIHDVIYLDPHAKLRYEQNGDIQTESLEKNLDKDFQPRWLGIQNSKTDWAVELPASTSVSLKARGNYAVIEMSFGKMASADKPYIYNLRYRVGPRAIEGFHARK